MEYQQEQLSSLIAALDDLIAVLELDHCCHWVKHFLTARSQARSLSGAMSQDKLNSFLAAVPSVYAGMGSFNDYYPCPSGKRKKAPDRIHNMDNFVTFSSAVYNRAINLRVIGTR